MASGALPGGVDDANAVVVNSSGRIFVGGASNGDFAIAAYRADGSLDPTFGQGGLVTTNFCGASTDGAAAMSVDGAGSLVLAGSTSCGHAASGPYDFALARYGPNGSLDRTFGANGKVMTDLGPGTDSFGTAVAIDSSGRIVVAGLAFPGSAGNRDFALVRYTPEGSLDRTFGEGGRVLTNIGTMSGGAPSSDEAEGVAIDPSGGLIAVGSTSAGPFGSNFALLRYGATGHLDPTFGTGGSVITAPGPGTGAQARAVALDSTGRILVAGIGSTANNYGNDVVLARYNQSGALDGAFGSGGVVSSPFASAANAVMIEPSGDIVAAGGPPFSVGRYTQDGSPDTAFGSGGAATTDFGYTAKHGAVATGVERSTSGSVVAAGILDNGAGNHHFALARYISDGSLDPTFGSNGEVVTVFPPNTRLIEAMVNRRKGNARFRFNPIGKASFFQCSLASKRHPTPSFRHCATAHETPLQKAYKHLKSGRYVFRVRAVGPGGSDVTPARRSFTVAR